MMDVYVLMWVILGPLIGYAAAERRGFSKVGGVIGGILLGPLLAWLMFFVSGVAKAADPPRTCPYCAERIQAAAIVCKHCHRELPKGPQATTVRGVVVNEGFDAEGRDTRT